MSISRIRDAYSDRADEYIEAFGSIGDVHPKDLALVHSFAKRAGGPLVDAGCGPGHWTALLHEHGCEVEGVDLSPAFIERARQRFPHVPFRVGNLEALGRQDGSVAGILSWYSIIHTEPRDVGPVLREFARCVTAGGLVLLGFFDGPAVEAFEHKVVTAYRWPVTGLCGELEDAGFAILEVHMRTDPGHRPHGAILARRAGSGEAGEPATAPRSGTINAA
ncbi:class I SAM-dependent methyltransferase [Paeniglutamicibacter sp. MACA_103]|uniref:class I SAM-dependent methyltransferase n=1 Tax=Paeniglutamicibacter sp. MACA_103 TaxID=3377337 RepID=UPI00389540AB